jgi:plastocyanin
MRPRALLAVSTLVGLMLAGCALSQPASTQTAAQPDTVSMARSYRFEPVLLQVPAGTTVTWVNDDNFTHNVQFAGALEWTSPSLRPGQSTSRVFETPGEYDYVCTFHTHDMHARLVVLPRAGA